MNKVPWTKVCSENFRVEVSRKGAYRLTERDYDTLADDLNELFEAHTEWKDANAEVNCDEVVRCIFCDDIYTPALDEKENEYCSSCGKGKLEYSIKRMVDSEKRGTM